MGRGGGGGWGGKGEGVCDINCFIHEMNFLTKYF